MPTPTADPLIAAIIGFVHLVMANVTRPPPSLCVVTVGPKSCFALKSMPAQKMRFEGSEPDRMMQRTRGSAERRS